MFLFCALLIYCIVFSASILNSSFKNITPISKPSYYDIEDKMINNTKKYVSDNYKNIKNDLSLPIELQTLIVRKYINNIKDSNY
ncbi:MAG: hypothetical protein RR325_00695 [Bacilli bacterium]